MGCAAAKPDPVLPLGPGAQEDAKAAEGSSGQFSNPDAAQNVQSMGGKQTGALWGREKDMDGKARDITTYQVVLADCKLVQRKMKSKRPTTPSTLFE